MAKAVVTQGDNLTPADQNVPGDDTPVKKIDGEGLRTLGVRLQSLFNQYKSDRFIAEQRWLQNLRQYLGIYDPNIERQFSQNRSRAYPRTTMVKCVSVLSRLMNLMFPGNERNWELRADPSADMTADEVKQAVKAAYEKDTAAGGDPPQLTRDYIKTAIQTFCDANAKTMSDLIDGQLQEVGGDQTFDYVALNRRVIRSGIQYGPGYLCGPYARKSQSVKWDIGPNGFTIESAEVRKPQFDFVTVWDLYPDMSAKTFTSMDGYFRRHVMSRGELRKLADREDFLGDQIKAYLKDYQVGNYRPQPYEWELRTMGVKVNVNEQKVETRKYEVLAWHGKMSGDLLRMAGIEVVDDKLSDDLDAEIWTIDGYVIKAELNPWAVLGVDVKTLHTFLFDEDDTSPVGFGLPNKMRDSQMMISAATRMMMDNASVTCGPIQELNLDLLLPEQDLTVLEPYKMFYRTGDDVTAQWPAIRAVPVASHMEELLKIIDLGMKNADAETFVGPATGGDMSQAPSEPMRTAAGASMLRGDAALPFKDVVRSFDQFTQSVIESLVQFNRKFNPDLAPDADYDVIARGATSLIAKEIRGAQADQMAQTLTPDDMPDVNRRALLEARFKARDMEGMMAPKDEADRVRAAQAQQSQDQQKQQSEATEAQIRKLLSDAYKNIAQGQKNTANADATTVQSALDLLEKGLGNAASPASPGDGGEDTGMGTPQVPQFPPGNPGGLQGGGVALPPPGGI